MTATKSKSKKLKPAHFKRRRAEEHAERMTFEMIAARKEGHYSYINWLRRNGMPEWTTRFEVRPVRLRFHYAVYACER